MPDLAVRGVVPWGTDGMALPPGRRVPLPNEMLLIRGRLSLTPPARSPVSSSPGAANSRAAPSSWAGEVGSGPRAKKDGSLEEKKFLMPFLGVVPSSCPDVPGVTEWKLLLSLAMLLRPMTRAVRGMSAPSSRNSSRDVALTPPSISSGVGILTATRSTSQEGGVALYPPSISSAVGMLTSTRSRPRCGVAGLTSMRWTPPAGVGGLMSNPTISSKNDSPSLSRVGAWFSTLPTTAATRDAGVSGRLSRRVCEEAGRSASGGTEVRTGGGNTLSSESPRSSRLDGLDEGVPSSGC
mmetsp:Transcript_6434/g.22130  ORF Transcript_6434/g.22130 Transcript_6434/m.22130 type:complete len:295 (-) Transcript_6434:307-1191(-)